MRGGHARVLAVVLTLAAAGCGTDRIDPPSGDDRDRGEVPVADDSLATWARRAREGWAAGDTTHSSEAAEWARAAFAGIWEDRLAADDTDAVRDAEHLPTRREAAMPTVEAVRDDLAGLGLAADIVVAEGPAVLWQVVLRDPTGGSRAATEFWAWPDPEAPLGPPVLQPLPANAPARARYGPEAVGALATWARGDGAGLASAWTRPRGGSGLEVALLRRPGRGGRAATWRVDSTRLLPISADSVSFVAAGSSAGAPSLVVRGAGARDRLFDECPTCPHLDRRQRYTFEGSTWTLREERTEATPYAAIVDFMNALRLGGPEAALPYAAGGEVLEQVRELGLERGPITPLRAAPGTAATDRTQRYRRGGSDGSDGLEVTLEPRGERWVVADLRPTRLVIE
jgi:hypothetical protein